jgi:hypothetical protein
MVNMDLEKYPELTDPISFPKMSDALSYFPLLHPTLGVEIGASIAWPFACLSKR